MRQRTAAGPQRVLAAYLVRNGRIMGSRMHQVGVIVFRGEDYPVLLEIFQDADKMPPTWKEWLANGETGQSARILYGPHLYRSRTFQIGASAEECLPIVKPAKDSRRKVLRRNTLIQVDRHVTR
jgi:hypothetical protein